MEWLFYICVVMCLIDIEGKLTKLLKPKKEKTISLASYLNKDVYIHIDNDDLLDIDLENTVGQIVDYDNEWFVFRFSCKNKYIYQYLRVSDIESIDLQ